MDESPVEGVQFSIQGPGAFGKDGNGIGPGLFLQGMNHLPGIGYIANSHWNIIGHKEHLFKERNAQATARVQTRRALG